MNIRAIAYVEFLPPANEVWGKVIFLQTSVILSGGGVLHLKGGLHPGRVYIQWGGCLHPGGWADPPPQALRDTVNKRAVRVLLECILVSSTPCGVFTLPETDSGSDVDSDSNLNGYIVLCITLH